MSQDQHTTEQAPGEPLYAPESAETPEAGTERRPSPLNEPQTDAQSFAARTQLEARVFNAVLPALRESGEWLPLSARRAVARAVLAELKSELDALAEYENTINWHTTCKSCARTLDSAYSETRRAEQAEATVVRVTALAERWRYTGDRKEGPLRELRAALQPPAHDAGPTVAEAKADDRRWPLEKHGE